MGRTVKKASVFLSYNPVGDFRSGWHANGRAFICASDNGRATAVGQGSDDFAKAGSVMHRISGQYYHGAVPVDRVRRYYIYAGLYAMRQAIEVAKSLRSASEAPVTVVACSCDSDKKRQLLAGTGIDIDWCECGGRATLGRLAEAAMTR